METETKPFWASKTLWTNAIIFLATIAGAFGIDLGLDAETQTSLVIGIMAVVNIILRLVTKSGVSASGG